MKTVMTFFLALTVSAITTTAFATSSYYGGKPAKPVVSEKTSKPGKPVTIGKIHSKPGKPGKPGHHGKPGKPGKDPKPPITKVPEINGAGTAIAFALVGGLVLIARERRRMGNSNTTMTGACA